MTKAKENTEAAAVDHRSPDQDAAIEAAFIAGTLPEEDRRHPEAFGDVLEPATVEATTHPHAEALRLLDLAEQETGYAQAELFKQIRKALI